VIGDHLGRRPLAAPGLPGRDVRVEAWDAFSTKGYRKRGDPGGAAQRAAVPRQVADGRHLVPLLRPAHLRPPAAPPLRLVGPGGSHSGSGPEPPRTLARSDRDPAPLIRCPRGEELVSVHISQTEETHFPHNGYRERTERFTGTRRGSGWLRRDPAAPEREVIRRGYSTIEDWLRPAEGPPAEKMCAIPVGIENEDAFEAHPLSPTQLGLGLVWSRRAMSSFRRAMASRGEAGRKKRRGRKSHRTKSEVRESPGSGELRPCRRP
jgi:hypothetical protein